MQYTAGVLFEHEILDHDQAEAGRGATVHGHGQGWSGGDAESPWSHGVSQSGIWLDDVNIGLIMGGQDF